MTRQRTSLGALCKLVKGTSPISKTTPGPYTLVTTGKDHKTAETFQFAEEAVCIPLISSTGHGHASLKRVHHQTGKFALGNLLVAAIVKDKSVLSAKFLARYLMFTKDRLIVPLMTGAANMSISIDRLATVPIEIPSLAEQERIVTLLDEAEELRELRAQADRRTAHLLPTVFHAAFGDPAGNQRQWPLVKFGELVADIRNGINPPKSKFGTGVPFVTVTNLYDGLQIKTEELHRVSISEVEEAKYKLLPGDICFARSSVKRDGVGMPSVFAATSPAVFGGFVIRVRVKPELDPLYACSFFLLPSTRRRVIESSNTATITNISQPSLLQTEIPVPPLTLQTDFAQRVKEIREIEADQATTRTRLDALFQSLLHNSFNGER